MKRAVNGKGKLRVQSLDILRGFSLVSMIVYHGMFDLVFLFGKKVVWYTRWPGYLWQQSICWVFILVSGASLHYGRNTWRRSLEVLGCAILLTIVTKIAMPSQLIVFGVLHFMGLSMLLAKALAPLLERIPSVVGGLASFLLFAFVKSVPRHHLGFFDYFVVRLPDRLYSSKWFFWLGFPGPDFFSGDYFPLIPWFFLFLCGYFIWDLLKGRVVSKPVGKNPLAFLGRHSLIVYMLHQPVIYGVLWLLNQVRLL